MSTVWRIVGILFVFGIACVAWLMLGVSMFERAHDRSESLGGEVAELWGNRQAQEAPTLTFIWTTRREVVRTEVVGSSSKVVREQVEDVHEKEMSPKATSISARMGLDQRLRGLMWYSLYNLDFDGQWTYTHLEGAGTLRIQFKFADPGGLYDDFRVMIDGHDRARELRPENGLVTLDLPIATGQTVSLGIGYRTRGMDEWRYRPATGVANLENFKLELTTDFTDIDFPAQTMSPTAKTRTADGWKLSWGFKQLVTGHAIGLATPQPIQPGELATELSFSAPISLMFFFLVIFVLATLRRIEIHPMNYLFIAAAFFAFHLLFAYSVDHLRVVPAFALSSGVSVLLVVSYLRLVVSPRFAFVEATGAQLVYLVGFSLAHFWKGYTGLTVTVLSIVTLFLLMQLTGRLKWGEVLAKGGSSPASLAAEAPNGG